MKITKIFLLISLIIFSNASFSQIINIKLGPAFGLTTPSVDYSGETQDFYAGTKYGLKSGFNFGVMGKVNLGPIGGRAAISYVSMSNNGQADPNTPNSTVEVKNSLFMFSLGAEFGITIPFTPVRPYADLDLIFSTISGSFKYQGTPNVSSDQRDISSATRTGLGFAVGSEVGFGKTFVLDLSIRYNLHNLFSKSYTVVTNSNRIDAYTSLNDDADPDFNASDVKHPVGSSRTIATIQFQVGLLFGF